MTTSGAEPKTDICEPRDIIRTPVQRDGEQRVLAVCERCGEFRDVTGVDVERVFALLHPEAALAGCRPVPPEHRR